MSKYASLPDVDLGAQDVYESKEVADIIDNTPAPKRRPSIEDTALSRQAAVKVFETKEVESTDSLDFSDAVKVQSTFRDYRVKTIPETLEARIARLQREVEEVRLQAGSGQRRNVDRQEVEVKGTMDNLKDVLDKLATGSGGRHEGYALFDSLGEGSHQQVPEYTTVEISKAVNALVRIEDRLAAVEKLVGAKPDESNASIKQTLEDLRQKVGLLTSGSDVIDKNASKLRELANYADKVRIAKDPATLADTEDVFEKRRIEAIYDKLPVLDKLEITVPHVVNRLKSLHSVHADAAAVVGTVRDVNVTVDNANHEIKQWIEAIKKAEKKLVESRKIEEDNKKEVEAWVKSIEEKVAKLT